FQKPTPAQTQAWPVVRSGESTLLMAPTGSGKTLAAFLSSIDALIQSPARGCRVVYVSPLKALAVDVERNLRSPIAGIGHAAVRRPLEQVARFLGGFDAGGPRPVRVVDAGHRKPLDLVVEVPVEDMARLGEPLEFRSGPASRADARTSIWPAIYPRLLELVREHRSTLIFVNSRRLAERIANAVNDLAGEELAHSHHGSVAREQRLQIEDDLTAGRLRALV